jgi:NAD(P)-dependent dehydrogenase (short-subunit alcohol dehydrogenase family)
MAETGKLMTGKTCIVTGANRGIGKTTALGLAKMGATVVMVCRSRERGEQALAEIRREAGNDSVSLLLADLSSQAAIRHLADEFRTKYSTLHVLINNAGIIPRSRTVTEDGFETQFAVNHLAYFLLTNLLLDRLKASTPSRIINVSSQVHGGPSIPFDDLHSERSYSPTRVYGWTKLANVLFTYELARRLEGTRVTVNCLHPGTVVTNMLADYMPGGLRFVAKMIGVSPEEGAQTSLYLATSPEVEGMSGKYFAHGMAVQSSKASYDKAAASRLWRVSAELTGVPVSA